MATPALDFLTIKYIVYAFVEVPAQSVRCVAEDSAVRLDAPFILPDRRPFRVYLRLGPEHEVIVLDAGYTSQTVTIFSRFEEDARTRYEKPWQIAGYVDIEHANSQLRFVATSLEQAIRRIPTLANAVVVGLGVLT